jgi:hypothetical protein
MQCNMNYSFKLIIQLFFFKCEVLIQLFIIGKVQNQKNICLALPCMTWAIQCILLQCIYIVILAIFSLGLDSTYVRCYYTLVHFHQFSKTTKYGVFFFKLLFFSKLKKRNQRFFEI